MKGDDVVLFSHSGNMGDLLYSLYVMTELAEHMNSGIWLHLQTNVRFEYSGHPHPNGNVGFTESNVDFMRPLLETIPLIRKITSGDGMPQHSGVSVNLSDFRKIGLNLSAGNIPQWYYNLVRPHLPQDFSRQLIHVEPDYRFRDKAILVHSTRYCNAFTKLDCIRKYAGELVFIGLESEHQAFCKKWFDVDFYRISDALEFARILAGSRGAISNQTGLYVIAELMKVPRVLMSYEYGVNNEGNLVIGCPDALPCGGWHELVQANCKLESAVENLMGTPKVNALESRCNHGIDAWLNENVFKGKTNGTYIECGANDGIRDSISWYYETHFGWSGILVEPLQAMMERCRRSRGNRNIFIQKGLGEQDGSIEIEVPDDNLDNASIVMSETHRDTLRRLGYGRSFHKETIDVISYKTLLDIAHVSHVDLAIFDVEGYESHILSGLMRSQALPEVMVVEKDWSDRDELIRTVAEKYDIIGEFQHDIIFRLRQS